MAYLILCPQAIQCEKENPNASNNLTLGTNNNNKKAQHHYIFNNSCTIVFVIGNYAFSDIEFVATSFTFVTIVV
jgi:hypothetical protein